MLGQKKRNRAPHQCPVDQCTLHLCDVRKRLDSLAAFMLKVMDVLATRSFNLACKIAR
jgi:hypothetical protein